MNEQPSDSSEVTNTGGGAYIKGGVNISGGDFVGRDKNTTIFNYLFDSTPETGQYLRARKILLENVNKFWVEGVLKHSLHKEALLTLGLEESPNAVDNRPWDMVLQIPQQPDRPLPPGTRIIDVFDQQQQSLLILGMPGSGKTTMLIELARGLILRAQKDVTFPIPVVLNLSSWAVERQSLKDWLIDELNSKYYIAEKIANFWVEQNALLLLLDGLDEVQQDYRDACVNAINAFCKAHLVYIAVCSRIVDYEILQRPLLLHGAVILQPLAPDQINEYFMELGTDYEAVLVALQKDRTLQELAQSPLMLSIMTLAYQGTTAEGLLKQESLSSHRQYLFNTYIKRMFLRRGRRRHLYRPRQMLRWLTWLAKNMYRREQTIFLIEWLQPDWLYSSIYIWLYKLSVGINVGLIVSLIFSLIFGLSSWMFFGQSLWLAGGLVGGLVFGFAAGLGVGPSDIEPTERLVFTGRMTKSNLIWGLVSGISSGLVSGLGIGLVAGLIVGLAVGLGIGLHDILGTGLRGRLFKRKEAAQHIRPNQGIWHSAQNMWIGGCGVGLIFGIIFGLSGGLIFGISRGLSSELSSILVDGLIFGLIFGISSGLSVGLMRYGGSACIQHLVLRIFLCIFTYTPLNYARFLNYAANQLFLYKVGGGYIFIHRLLMEHFASLTEENIKRLAGSEKTV